MNTSLPAAPSAVNRRPTAPPTRRGPTAPRPAGATDPLIQSEVALLADLEHRVEHGLQSFLEVGAALVAIRDGRLYRATYATFEAYLAERWGMSRPRAYQLIGAAEVVAGMSTVVDKPLPTTERQVRPLAALPPAERPVVWDHAVALAEKQGKPVPTARHVEHAVAEIVGTTVNATPTADPFDALPYRRNWGSTRTRPPEWVIRNCLNTIDTVLGLLAERWADLPPEYHAAGRARLAKVRTRLTRLVVRRRRGQGPRPA